ncbi:MAG: hypothetical protein DLM53_12725 [Candidatus Eremiobacter antarcticus]|nr:hypothetical protein [Candidatus Eremiobacteraeota bacterium]MBC5807652.1 hypothetical protein [Candidatus Eremiobacteraeota bacterium]PZR60505.1 MAG: hypothetical protein DLM53_12725 [Candidatus Eremiobacter sp. RRmetagenome_bin22]
MAEQEVERGAPTEFQRLGAEFFGTFLLTLVAAGADIIDAKSGGEIGHTARYFAPGLLYSATQDNKIKFKGVGPRKEALRAIQAGLKKFKKGRKK